MTEIQKPKGGKKAIKLNDVEEMIKAKPVGIEKPLDVDPIKPKKLETKPVPVEIQDDAATKPHFVESLDLHETTFKSLPIPDWLLSTLTTMGYEKPTTIQEKAIPLAIEGRDILASSQTGSGKTVAFGVPVMAKLVESAQSGCLILAPTRELAAQIKTVIHALRGDKKIFTALLVGGEPIMQQFKQLKSDPRIIIATPGRLIDHIKRGTVKLGRFDTLVLDEFDRMLEMGFKEAIEQIFRQLAESKQTLMFSATTRDSVMKLAQKYLKNPVEIKVGVPKSQPLNIKQEFVYTTHAKKYSDLLIELEKRHGSIIIFVGTKHGVDNLADKLEQDGKSVDVIHVDLRQRQRENVIKSFRNEKFEILVATDVVARGIDIPHIMHVINYDMPQCLEDYNHRIGRTGRAVGSEGSSLCLVCLPGDKKKYNNIKMGLNSDEMEPETYGRKGGGNGGGRSGGGNRSGNSGGGRFSNRSSRDSSSGGGERRTGGGFGGGGNFGRRKPRD